MFSEISKLCMRNNFLYLSKRVCSKIMLFPHAQRLGQTFPNHLAYKGCPGSG